MLPHAFHERNVKSYKRMNTHVPTTSSDRGRKILTGFYFLLRKARWLQT